MSVMEVQAPGLFTTVQDLGREGFGPLGVSLSGAADAIALRLGNRLVANAETAAGLEMTLIGGAFRFPEGAVLALTGSDFGATLDGAPVSLWNSFEAAPGQTLVLGPSRSGARCYLCVRGGIAVEPFLGSASTHILSGLGGLQGRALRKGDVLNIGAPGERASLVPHPAPSRRRAISPQALRRLSPRKILRVTPGPQSHWFPEPSRRVLCEGVFRVTEESNRMGIRLEGTDIPAPSGREMITEGVSLGAIQVPPGGRPIILFVEQQTTGGYPVIANVISTDMGCLGQLRPRDEIRFAAVEMETARSLLQEQEKLLASKELMEA